MRLFCTFFILAALSACTPSPSPSSPETAASNEAAWVLHRLYLGRGLPEGREVSPAQWEDFLHNDVTHRFPAGLTHWSAQGQWRNEAGALSKENSFVLEVLVPATDDQADDDSIRAIIDAYKQQFEQESVLWLRDPTIEATFR